MTLLALLLFVGRVERVNRYDVLERNEAHADAARAVAIGYGSAMR